MVLALPGCQPEAADPAAGEPSSAPLQAPAEMPEGTDVWILDLQATEGGSLAAAEPRNLTRRPGYDNQPLFTPAGELLYVQDEGEDTDLWRWNPDTGVRTRLTSTPDDGEYSPTPMPGGAGDISYIRSKTDTTGRVWRMEADGGNPEVVFPDIVPVGYHAWLDADHVALWRLQEPSVLELAEVASGARRRLAVDVGRSPQSVPGRRAVSYTRPADSGGGRVIVIHDPDLDGSSVAAPLPEGGEFHAWTPEGLLLATAGSRILVWRDEGWETVADLGHLGVRLSRIAVSPDGGLVAVVGEAAGP